MTETPRNKAPLRKTHPTASPGRIGLIARAALVLVLFEHKMIK